MPTEALHFGIEVKNLTKRYRAGWFNVVDGLVRRKQSAGYVTALRDFCLSINPGEAFGLIGPNGAGKTTFMACLLGYIFPDQGSISIDGKPPDHLETRASFGYLPERLVFDRFMTGYAFLSHHHALSGGKESNCKSKVEELLDKVRLEKHAWHMPIRKYSRGMLQRIGLAQALVGEPKYLFLDEPASGVDPGGVIVIREILKELRDGGMTIVLNSHQLTEVENICDRVAFIRSGTIESIHTMHTHQNMEKTLLIKFSNKEIGAASCADAADGEKIVFVDISTSGARFKVQDDDAAATLLAKLTSKGLPVVAAIPERSSLEVLFVENQK